MAGFDKLLMFTLVSGMVCGCGDEKPKGGEKPKKSDENPDKDKDPHQIAKETRANNVSEAEKVVEETLKKNPDFEKKTNEQKQEIIKKATNAVLSMSNPSDIYDKDKKTEVKKNIGDNVTKVVEKISDDSVVYEKAENLLRSDKCKNTFSQKMFEVIKEYFVKPFVEKTKKKGIDKVFEQKFKGETSGKLLGMVADACKKGCVLAIGGESVIELFCNGCADEMKIYLNKDKTKSYINELLDKVNVNTQENEVLSYINMFLDSEKELNFFASAASYIAAKINKEQGSPLFIINHYL